MRKANSIAVLMVGTMLSLTLLGAAKPSSAVRDAGIRSAVTILATSKADCGKYHCNHCAFFTAHENVVGAGGTNDQLEQFDCADVGCPSGCIITFEENNASAVAWEAAKNDNIDALKDLVAADPHVVYNAAREAIQIIGCNGMVTDHIPLTHDQAVFLNN